jgi:hypothetical protein
MISNSEPYAVARNSDPWTSHQAAASVKDIRASQQIILDVLKAYGPLNDGEIFSVLNNGGVKMSLSGARTRRKELTDMGFVVDTGHRAFTPANRRTIVWALRGEH